MARLLSVNVGLPRDVVWQGRTVHTGIWKTPIEGRRRVRKLNIDGDGQGDAAGHGGEQRAVYVYQDESYRFWQEHLGRANLVPGQFGENFTVEGLVDSDVCIGDRFRIGSALLEVTQPRVTCYRLGIRMQEPDMAALLVKHGRPGFYCRVIEEGDVGAGDEIIQVARGPESMSVSEINALLYLPPHPRDRLECALKIPALSRGWRHSFEALLGQNAAAGNAGLGPAANPAPAWRGFRPFRVVRKIFETDDVTSLVLEPADGRAGAAALPGQFVIIRLGPSGTPAMTRSYSLSSNIDAASYRVSIKREPHGMASAYVADELQPGDVVQLGAPRGSFTLRQDTRPVVLLSAGIGVTPVLAMLHALATEESQRDIWWLHGTRNGREHAFGAEVRELLTGLPHHHGHVRYSRPDPGDRLGIDFDSVGRLDAALLRQLDLPRDGDFYLCGPATFMSDLTSGLRAWGVAPDRIHTELFGAGPSLTPGIATSATKIPPHVLAGAPGPGPVVSFARSGLNVRWGPSYASLLELAETCDVPVRWSCRTGVCHNCESGLIAGDIGYQPNPLDAPADGNVLICCARPVSDIVIDL
ncbi:MOSC and FAD-binding oxidoreductase domain-containing protein [Bradyrhizobium guangzhouense]|uniref:nitric oxide dioxygenase n=1 Tax=Bradyrhizobium guangzhouense TaxID=1325095 RepID=A0AAE6C9K9_9BRAD|nr:MOSC and FAD-binding oxidoreductase domain-containing protein [Bradyrhizobium guangzhouense]QAU47709.1 sulfurase [Bradyrhizobium guangzhouense]RXH14926.1 MOSC domain-containing protein [Bradyrhizobium guangzhouense]